MPDIMIRCPTTRREVPTGLTTEAIKFDSLYGITIPMECPECGRTHTWKREEAWTRADPGKCN
jgi:hypothetical protein